MDSDEFKSKVLEQVAFIRAFEAKALALTQLSPPPIQGSVHLCAGQEVVPVAAISALREDDQVVCTYRGHGWALAAGMSKGAVMGELCHKAAGLNGGRGGSAYMMAPNTRFIGENSIVGAGTTIACGVAIANVRQGNGRIVIVTIGDGAMNQGAVHEAMALAAARSLPVVFVVENNGWSELTATADMFRIDRLAKRASGYGFPSATIDGTDAIAVRDSVGLAAARARNDEGPSLLEFRVPRLWGHYHRDPEHYRSKENKRADEERDPLRRLQAELEGGIYGNAAATVVSRAEDEVESLTAAVLQWEMLSQDKALSEVTAPATDHAKLSRIETREMTYVQAVNTALREILAGSPEALLFGEDVGKSGGIFQASRHLYRDFGADRVFDMPISENAILGSAVGAAIAGMRPIAEIMWADFIFVALDQLVNQAANIRYITGGKTSVPMVVRTQQGVTPGSCAQHSRSIEAMLCHVPGLKVAIAATADDAYSLLKSAAADEDPCVVIEARSLYPTRGEVNMTAGAEPVGRARLHTKGNDVAIITWGTMLAPCIEAASQLREEGVLAAVLDLRWLSPIDEKQLYETVESAGGRVVVVHEAARTGGFAAELIVRLQEHFGGKLAVSARRVTGPDAPMPACPDLQSFLLPGPDKIKSAVLELYSNE
jgi:2-oxoisovalerate dehydrogenase E1 component